MNWYYALNGQQTGPVTEAEFEALITAGTITATTLVWHEGLAEWQPLAQARPGVAPVPSTTPPLVGGVVCSQCKQSFGPDQVIRYGESWVCAGCKPLFIQKLREGVSAPAGEREYAGIGQRFAAKFLDNIILQCFSVPLGFVMGAAGSQGGGAAAVVAVSLSYVSGILIAMAYTVFFTYKYQATPGKMALKIKVVMADDSPLTLGRCFARYFAEILSGITCAIGYLIAIGDAEKRALHDRLCNTRVVRK